MQINPILLTLNVSKKTEHEKLNNKEEKPVN